MRIYSLVGLFALFFAATTSEIEPERAAEPTAPVEVEETEETEEIAE